jgi:release factor glutamine methyltransferase
MTSRSIGACVARGAEILAGAGIESPRREARLLLAHAAGQSFEWIIAHPETDCGVVDTYDGLIERRRAREPFSHIVGVREFWSLLFRVSADVLDPRADSETLVSAALACFPARDRALRVLDLGTGSGCLLLSFLHERPLAMGVGVDRSPAALTVARENACDLGLADRARFLCADWVQGLSGRFDLILANPPYIPAADIAGLSPEVSRYEPRAALDGGASGLDCYHAIAAQLPTVADANTRLVLEFGIDQAHSVSRIFQACGFTQIEIIPDLAGLPRCLMAGGLTPEVA